MKNTTAIAVTNASLDNVEPPASKAELIEALALREFEIHTEKRDKVVADHEAALSNLNAAIQEHLLERLKTGAMNGLEVEARHALNWSTKKLSTMTLVVECSTFPAGIKSLSETVAKTEKALGDCRQPSLDGIRKQIKESLGPARRANEFLKNPKLVKALDATLKNLGRPT